MLIPPILRILVNQVFFFFLILNHDNMSHKSNHMASHDLYAVHAEAKETVQL